MRRLLSGLPAPLQHRLRRLRWRLSGGERELALLPPLADPHRTFLDIGAHRGLYLEHARGHFARLVGIEPHPDLFAYLARCFAGRAAIHGLALSDREGTLTLHVPVLDGRPMTSRASLDPTANGPVEHRILEVPVAPLDSLDLPPLAFVKIDVEGHERAVLRGARSTLGRDRPRLLIEIEERHHPGKSAGVFADLAALGYRAFHLDREGRLRPTTGDVVALQRSVPADRPGKGGRPGYIKNFVFLHRDDREALARLRAAGRLAPEEGG